MLSLYTSCREVKERTLLGTDGKVRIASEFGDFNFAVPFIGNLLHGELSFSSIVFRQSVQVGEHLLDMGSVSHRYICFSLISAEKSCTARSEERRVGKECRSGRSPSQYRNNK